MKITVRTLSPALISACLALPLIAEQHKQDADKAVHANIQATVLTGETMADTSLGQVTRISDVIGLEVRNLQDEKLGKVNDLAVDVASGRIVEVIVSTGGVLGVGSTLIAVPPAAFHYDHKAKVLHLDRSKESLKTVPVFDAAQWDTHVQSSNVVEVYRAYGVAPYFGAGQGNAFDRNAQVNREASADITRRSRINPDGTEKADRSDGVDNTARNRRDRDGNTLTPLDQGNSASDVAITARIRKEVMASEGLSVNAQNVKIITVDGRVTLRGPVNTQEEKTTIGEIAARAVSASDVDNQLEVKRDVSKN